MYLTITSQVTLSTGDKKSNLWAHVSFDPETIEVDGKMKCKFFPYANDTAKSDGFVTVDVLANPTQNKSDIVYRFDIQFTQQELAAGINPPMCYNKAAAYLQATYGFNSTIGS